MSLSSDLIVEEVDDILYRIGLTFESFSVNPKRDFINHPLFAFISVLLFFIKSVILITLSDKNGIIFHFLVDMGHFIGIRRQFNYFLLVLSLITLSSQALNFYNYKKGIKPKFMLLFQMMAGHVQPKDLGLTNPQDIKKLVSMTKMLVPIIRANNNYVFPSVAIIFNIILSAIYGNLREALTFGVLNGIFLAPFVYYFINFLLYQFLIFFVLNSYLKMRINRLNEILIEMQKKKRFKRIRETLHSFNSLYSEINDFNTNYWSKFFAFFWLFFGSDVILLLFTIIFVPLPLTLLLIFSYAWIIYASGFLSLIFTASSLNSCANSTYKLINSLNISYSMYSKHIKASTLMKV